MKNKILSVLCLALALAVSARATDITIVSQTVPGTYPSNLGQPVPVAATVTQSSLTVTSAVLFRPQWVGLGGFTVEIAGVRYTVANVVSTSSLQLTTAYAGTSGAATVTFFPYLEIRLYSDKPFYPAGDDRQVPGGSSTGIWFKRYAASVIAENGQQVLYWPQMVIPATTDGTPIGTAKYNIAFFAPASSQQPSSAKLSDWACGGKSSFYVRYHPNDFAVTTQSWRQICEYNQAPVMDSFPNQYVTLQQFNSNIPTCAQGKLAGYANAGQALACINLGTGLSYDSGTRTLSASGGGGGIGGIGALYVSTAADLTWLIGTSFINADATATARTIGLLQVPPGAHALDIRKGDTSSNLVKINYAMSRLDLSGPGAWARFLPQNGGWVLAGAASGATDLGGGDAVEIGSSTPGSTPDVYTRPKHISSVRVNAADGNWTVALGTPGTRAADVAKTDQSSNVVRVTYNATFIDLVAPGQSVRFVPNGGSWVLWSTDPTFSGYAVEGLAYTAPAGATYNLAVGVGFVDSNASGQAQVVNLLTPGNVPVEVRKGDSTANSVTVNYNSTNIVLNTAGRMAKFVPDGSNWVLWAIN